jgi:endonuclease YncB( thermonuclease family)
MIRSLCLCLTLALLPASAFAYSGKVVAVTEGDTLTVLHNGKKEHIRLYGIDAPEKRQSYGNKASEFLGSFVQGERVDVERKSTDKKGRVVGIVSIGGDNVNELMVVNGQAWVNRQQCTESFCEKWIKMEEAARATSKGLWSDPSVTPPWEFRSSKKR